MNNFMFFLLVFPLTVTIFFDNREKWRTLHNIKKMFIDVFTYNLFNLINFFRLKLKSLVTV